MIIRPYRKGDFAAIMSLWTATGLSRPERGDDEKTVELTIELGGQMLVICDESENHRIIGSSWTTFDGRRLHLHHFGIDPQHQGKGLAKDLLREALRFVKEKGYQVKLEVHRSNRAAIDLYTRAGFEYLGDYDIYIIRDIQIIEV
ncbi:MAG: GNAT family N-acetyltransferase [Bacteroidales bacterium]|jgi:ribosomal protein S18 acetylase RimI-like enzyme|nr:GNAT family N-acetyltransferase [Bacteroidales bacterium]